MITLNVQQIVEEEYGVTSVYVNAVNAQGKTVAKKCYQVKKLDELKEKVKPLLKRLNEAEAKHDADIPKAQQLLDEIVNEET